MNEIEQQVSELPEKGGAGIQCVRCGEVVGVVTIELLPPTLLAMTVKTVSEILLPIHVLACDGVEIRPRKKDA